ncbi:DUF6304 family protein [Streptomyces sp. NPDC051907]|uniref:DUF6304 family protein n=1 Tax=Streptomyces sp. NPDC051907 TaxID=3155284 RepID=UPI003432060E
MSSESTEVWAGWHRDRRGAEAVAITASGSLAGGGQVRSRIRGVEYIGASFSDLAPVGGGSPLAACVLEWDMPLPVRSADGSFQQATLSCLLTLGEPQQGGPRERADLNLTLHYGGTAYESGVAGGDFGDALSRIQRLLPPGTALGHRVPAGA